MISVSPDSPRDPATHPVREGVPQLLANLNEPQLKVYQDGGIPTTLHQEYSEY